jgi:3-hydroxyisobutyrate dehydrogenase
MLKYVSKKFSQKVTFVGLGNMGYPMAQHLIKSGFKVIGFDSNKQVTEKFQQEAGERENSIESSISQSHALITMLPNSQAVDTVWNIASKSAKKGTYFIDSSTISPIDAKNFANKAKQNGFIPADSPVSGGVMGAQKATLSFMIGCDKEHFENIKSYLQPMGKNFFHCGESSFGQVAKVCNNLCLGITMVGLSESLALGVKLGIDPKILSNVMSVSSARCWSLDTYNPVPGVLPNVPSSRNYENGFSLELMCKDMKIGLDCLNELKIDAPLSETSYEHYNRLKKEKGTSKDFSIVYQDVLDSKKH